MFYDGLTIFLAILGAIALAVAIKVLLRSGWILGWLRGMCGVVLIAGGIIVGLIALDVMSYRQVLKEQTIATLSFKQLKPQHYQVVLVDGDGSEQTLELKGDQWQLDARMLKWKGFMSSMGIKPAYRLDRLGGRYYSLELERTAERTVHNLMNPSASIDLWHFVRHNDTFVPFLDAQYGTATYMPMKDGALYEVKMSHTGLLARPLNEAAKAAITRWR